MKKSLHLAFGCAMIAASFGIVGCDSGGGEGMPTAQDNQVAKSVSDDMKKMGPMAAPPKGGAPKIGKENPTAAPAADAK
jgi:hypothetical protein